MRSTPEGAERNEGASESTAEVAPQEVESNEERFGSQKPGMRFSLSALMLTMSLICVCLAVGGYHPALATIVVFLSAVSYVRTALTLTQAEGLAQGGDQAYVQIKTFAGSAAVVFGICAVFVLALVVGLIISATIAYSLVFASWEDGAALFSPMAVMVSQVFAIMVTGLVAQRLW